MQWPTFHVPVPSRTTLARILPLRHRVLREGLPLESASFEGDVEHTTWHLEISGWGPHDSRTEPFCCASLMLSVWDGEGAWRLRGMATDPDLTGNGLGRLLLSFAELSIGHYSPSRLFWCDAREPAIPFYEKLGWQTHGELFDIPTAGPHIKMTKRL